MSPYREPPKKKEVKKMKDRLYYVSISYKKDKRIWTFHKWIRAKDGYKALQSFIVEEGIEMDAVWETDVISLMDFIDKDNEID